MLFRSRVMGSVVTLPAITFEAESPRKGLGIKEKKGDQLVRIAIRTPQKLSPETEKIWQQLAEKSDFNPRIF